MARLTMDVQMTEKRFALSQSLPYKLQYYRRERLEQLTIGLPFLSLYSKTT